MNLNYIIVTRHDGVCMMSSSVSHYAEEHEIVIEYIYRYQVILY